MNDSISIHQRLADIAQNIGSIAKTRSNAGSYGSKYRSIDDLKNNLQPELAGFGVVMSTESRAFSETTFKDIDKNGKERLNWRTLVTIRVHFSCEAGAIFSDHNIAKNHAGDFGPKSATSLAISQAIETVFCISTEDPQQEAPAAPQQPQQRQQPPKQQRKPKPPATEKTALTENPFKKWGISQQEAVQIGEAIAAAKNRKELDVIWKKYPKLQKAEFFLKPIKKRTAEVSLSPHLQSKQLKTNK